jgi:hypothetical protein
MSNFGMADCPNTLPELYIKTIFLEVHAVIYHNLHLLVKEDDPIFIMRLSISPGSISPKTSNYTF